MQVFFELSDDSISDLVRLKAYCKQGVLGGAHAITEFSTGEFRGTGCVRAEERPVERSNGSLDVAIHKCRRDEIRCRVHEFFGENQGNFVNIATAVKKSPVASDDLRRIEEEVGLAQEDPERLCDNRVCRKLADAIIAIDGIGMDVFAANNDRKWQLIASVLKKPLINPVREQKSSLKT